MMKILIIGKGETCRAFRQKYEVKYDIRVIGRDEYDLNNSDDCLSIAGICTSYDAVLILAGKRSGCDKELWNSNFLGPALIAGRLIELNYQGHVVALSSHAANWSSWPGIDKDRLIYNCAKHSLSHFFGALNLGVDMPSFTIIEPPAYKTHLSMYKGHDIETIIDAIDHSLQRKVEKITIMRYNANIHTRKGDNDE